MGGRRVEDSAGLGGQAGRVESKRLDWVYIMEKGMKGSGFGKCGGFSSPSVAQAYAYI